MTQVQSGMHDSTGSPGNVIARIVSFRHLIAAVMGLSVIYSVLAKEFPPFPPRADIQTADVEKERMVCPPSQILTGFGQSVGGLYLVCARAEWALPIKPAGLIRSAGGKALRTVRHPEKRVCPTDHVIRSLVVEAVHFTKDPELVALHFNCQRPADRSVLGCLRFPDISRNCETARDDFADWPVDAVSSTRFRVMTCPGSEFAVGLHVVASAGHAEISSAGLICRQFSFPFRDSVDPKALKPGDVISGKAGLVDLDTERLAGADLARLRLGQGSNPDACHAVCQGRDECVAWTYVKSSLNGPLCILKHGPNPPAPVPNTCCVSGTVPRASSGQSMSARRLLPLPPGK